MSFETIQDFEKALQARGTGPSSIAVYAQDVAAFLGWMGTRPVNHFAVAGWLASLNGRIRPQTVGRKASAIKAYLGWRAFQGDAAATAALALLAAWRVTPVVRQRDRKEVLIPTRADYRQAWDRLTTLRHRACLDLLWFTGARISSILGSGPSEIPGLTVADGQALVARGIVNVLAKRGTRYRLVLAPGVMDLIRPFAELRAKNSGTDQRLFRFSCQARAEALDGVWQFQSPACRHHRRDVMRAAGISDELQQALLGHRSASVTWSYGRISDAELMQAVEKIWSHEEEQR